MLATGLRRVAATHQPQALARSQRRFGGSLHKNPHVETWNNWRGDSERRFKFDAAFFKATLAWGVVPFTLYYVMASGERRARDRRNGVPENFRQ